MIKHSVSKDKPMLVNTGRLIYPFIMSLLLAGCSTVKDVKPINPKDIAPVTQALYQQLPNKNQPFKVSITSAHNPLKIGQYLQLYLRSMSSGYVSLYMVGSSGKVGSLLENQVITGGTVRFFPEAGAKTGYQIGLPTGTEAYIIVVSRQPLYWLAPTDKLSTYLGLTTLTLNKNQLIKRLQQRVSQLSTDDWNINYIHLPVIN